MQTQCACRSLAPSGQGLRLRALTLCTFLLALLARPGFAQQDPEADPPSVYTTARNSPGDLPAQETENQTQSSSSIPNAPSAARFGTSQSSLTFGQRFTIYRHSIFSPCTLVGPALGAGIGQAENEPPEWKQGADGYAHRFGSGVGRHLIAETVRFAVAAADGEDPRYHRSAETGVWGRAKHAIAETFTSETSSGARIPAFSRFTGVYGAAFVSNLWYPDSRATTGWAMWRGSTALGSSLGFHLFEEFMPRKYFEALHDQQ
jgi:hypothetical protein